MCSLHNYSRFYKFILLPSINGAFLFHQTNQYAVPLTEPLLVDELNCRLDAPPSHVLRPDSTHIFGVNDALNRDQICPCTQGDFLFPGDIPYGLECLIHNLLQLLVYMLLAP